MTIATDAHAGPSNEVTGFFDLDEAATAFENTLHDADDAETPSEEEEKQETDESAEEGTPSPEDAAEEEEDGDVVDDEEEPEDDDEEEEEPEDEQDEADEEEEQADAPSVSDDTELEVTVNGEAKKVTVASLKRLAGQEAAITQRSMELADVRRGLEENHERVVSAYETLAARAEKEWAQFADLDFADLAKRLPEAEYAKVHAQAQNAFVNKKFLDEELDSLMEEKRRSNHEEFKKKAIKAMQVLSDPVEGIPGWDREMYASILRFAEENGMSREDVSNIVDPSLIKLLNTARVAATTKKSAEVKKKTAKAKKTASKVARTRKTPQSQTDRAKARVEALQRKARDTGNFDDVVDAIEATL
ncbi:hypothetical protein [Pyruvatibacter mobilis]|uniref:hypothetical protein n=1 Tax=Pyruvatibacter mobilis TaxID=1712261 RepID=UPI003BAAA43E